MYPTEREEEMRNKKMVINRLNTCNKFYCIVFVLKCIGNKLRLKKQGDHGDG